MKYNQIRFLSLALGLAISASSFGQAVKTTLNTVTGAVSSISIDGDDTGMNWIINADGSQYPWVGENYGWGLGYFTLNDTLKCSWNNPVAISEDCLTAVYNTGGMEITVSRSADGSDWVESYTIRNTGESAASLSDIGIFTPFNDNYPDALTCMDLRCHAHIWEGGEGAYVNLLRMGAKGPHMGMVVTEGAIDGYDVFERDRRKQSSQFRGVLALCPGNVVLAPGESSSLSWRIFSHNGDDFKAQLLSRGGVWASADRYVIEKGRRVRMSLECAEKHPVSLIMDGREVRCRYRRGEYAAKLRLKSPGSHRFEFTYAEGKKTWGEVLVVSSKKRLIAERERFIVENQQLNNEEDPRCGAFLTYDNEMGEIFLNDRPTCSPYDRNEGAERIGMGILLAKEAIRSKGREPLEPLVRYASFLRDELQTEDYVTFSDTGHTSRPRGYNYMWIAMFDFEMYRVTGDRKYAEDAIGTLKSFYDRFGYKFYAIHIPVRLGLKSLEDAGMTTEHDQLLEWYRLMGDTFVERGLNYPKHEVNYEQSIVAPAISVLCQLYLETGEQKYLDAATSQMPVLEAFAGDQPTYHKNGIAIRHWDGYWFGKREMLGDCFPHYWSVLSAEAFYFYAQCTGDRTWIRKAENIVDNNLCVFNELGQGSCAYVYPNHVNGENAKFYDPFANDQDFALVSYYLIKYGIL